MKRYGKDAYTMFRILSLAGRPIETDKVITLLWVPPLATEKIS